MKTILMLAAAAAAPYMVSAALTVEERGGGFAVLRDGKALVRKVSWDVGSVSGLEKSSFERLADGTKVWNRWCEDRAHRFRLEVAERADGTVEMSLLGESDAAGAQVTERQPSEFFRFLRFDVGDDALLGRSFEALEGDGRKRRPLRGEFSREFEQQRMRWLAVDGVIFDFNAIGPGESDSGYTSRAINGVWKVQRNDGNDGFALFGGGEVTRNGFGGFVGTKVVLREGSNADYPQIHFLRNYHYPNHLSDQIADVRRVCFGAPKFGKNYKAGNVEFGGGKGGFGWLDGSAARTVTVGGERGAYYSNVSGKGKATFRFAGLADGYYIATLHAGNWTGLANTFGAAVNGVPLGEGLNVPERKARTVSRAVHVTGGNVDVTFTGDWLVSAISLQPLLSDREDFSVRRGFWLTAGYEPATLYRSADMTPVAEFPVADETIDMPPQGGECAGECGSIEMPVDLPDISRPEFAWLRKAKTYRFLNNNSTLAEMDDPAVLKTFLDAELNGRDYASAMISGMHSRHTYRNHIRRGIDAIGRICDEFHRRGIKVFDHHDVTLLWNYPAGFLVLMERLPELVRGTSDYMPGLQLCPNNPVFRKTYFDYIRALVEKGVDGFQLDEVEFWSHGCQCKACRDGFHRDTGWWMPLDECHPALTDCFDPLAKALYEWRTKKITNWFIELRRHVRDVNPNLVFSTYTTHHGLTRSLPREYANYDILDFPRAMSYFGTEIMTRNVIQSSRPLIPYRRMYNLFSLQYGVPMWGWYYCSDWQGNYFAFATANMCGQSALLANVPSSPDAPDFATWSGSGFNMVREGASTVAEVALLFSESSKEWTRLCGFDGELFGTAQELEAMHVPYDIILEKSLEEKRLRKYKVLILGSSNCMSDGTAAAIRAFAKRGGTVILSGLTGLFDETGARRQRAAFRDITHFDPRRVTVTRPKPDDAPAFTEKSYGKGRFVFSTRLEAERFWAREVSPPNEWKFDPDPKGQQAFRAAMAQLVGKAAYWRTDAPDRVFTSIWRQKDGTMVVHFLNAAGANLKPGEKMVPESPVPAFPRIGQDITFTLPGAANARAAAASPEFAGERELASTPNADGSATIVLPASLFRAYTIVKVAAPSR